MSAPYTKVRLEFHVQPLNLFKTGNYVNRHVMKKIVELFWRGFKAKY